MFIVYLILIIVAVLMLLCALGPFFIKWNSNIPVKEEREAQEMLTSASFRIKRACKYQCLQCGNKLLPDKNGVDIKCYKCGNLWHPDYILTVYEDDKL